MIKAGSHIHLMGICGTAMASLAGLLKDKGFKVSGSDANPYPPMSTQIESLGISIMKGYSAANLHPKPDFVIVGNVISASNEEAQELIKLEIPYTSLPKAMGEWVIGDCESIVISGTHGKTTTTSLMAWAAEFCGEKPGYMVGGIPKNFSQSFRNPVSKYFIIEGDEYDTAFFDKVPKFIHYKPRHVVLTSVEFDHADIYKDLDAVKDSFHKLMELVPANGTLLACSDDANVLSMLNKCKASKVKTYGFKSGADYQCRVLNQNESGIEFEVKNSKDHWQQSFFVSMTGDYNILNATSVVGMARELGWDMQKVAESFKSFGGVKRRQEILGEPAGVLIIEDFAHHPTAVKETVKGIHSKYPQRKVFSVFEPRSATSRRKVFQKAYVEAFTVADEVLIARAFDQSKIDSENRFSSDELVSDLKTSGKTANCFDGADPIVQYLVQHAVKGDVVLIMSNGGFDGIYQKLIKGLEASV